MIVYLTTVPLARQRPCLPLWGRCPSAHAGADEVGTHRRFVPAIINGKAVVLLSFFSPWFFKCTLIWVHSSLIRPGLRRATFPRGEGFVAVNDHLPRKNAPRWNPYKTKGKTASRARARTLSLFCSVMLCSVLLCCVSGLDPGCLQAVSRLFPGWIQVVSNLDRCWKRKEISLFGIKLCRIPAFGPMPDFRLLPQTPHRSTGSTAAPVRRSARRRPPREPQADIPPWPPPVPVPGSGKR